MQRNGNGNNGVRKNGGSGKKNSKKISGYLRTDLFEKFERKKQRAAEIDGIRNLDNGTMLGLLIQLVPSFDRQSLARYAALDEKADSPPERHGRKAPRRG